MSGAVDFEARLEDHHCLLVLVQPLVPAGSLWERALGHIRRVRWTRLSDQQQPDGSRCVWLRYATSYPADGSLWGDFQAHRRVLGVLTVGECSDSHSVEALCGLHEQLLHQHPTAIDSRCFLFGSRPTLSAGDGEEDGSTKGQEEGEEARMVAPSMGKLRSTQCLLYPSLDGEQVERDVAEFAASLAWVLESRRLERSFDRPSSSSALPLLKAPFEDFVGLDTDSRQFRRRCQGRQRKQLGDLSLQLGLPREAQALYAEAQELLRGVPDWLWLAATLEGAVAATCPPSCPPPSSLPASSSSAAAGTPPATADKNGGEEGEAVAPPPPPPPPSMGCPPWLVAVEEGWEELRESCLHYAKYSPVAPILAECAVKAARWLAAHARPLGAAEFVQSVVSMNLAQSDLEKVAWYGSLARLYAELGLVRKAAFYMRVAALKCMVGKPNPTQCYHLLLKSLPGYRISMDPGKPAKAGPTDGWPRLQIQLLQDLLVTAKKMDNLGLAVSHLCQLLESLLDWLSPSERTEACQQLQSLASRLQGPASAQPPLLHLPLVRRFQPQAPAPHLRPLRLGSHGGAQGGGGAGGSSQSPFIFSPLQPHRRPGRPPMLWVQGEVAAVALQLGNPLPSELAVQHM
ncbi:trafficking protein particle complex subunit 9-like, partial [Haemaphysalis longicornis]